MAKEKGRKAVVKTKDNGTKTPRKYTPIVEEFRKMAEKYGLPEGKIIQGDDLYMEGDEKLDSILRHKRLILNSKA